MIAFKKINVTCNLKSKPFRVYRFNEILLFVKSGLLPDTDMLFLYDSKGYTYKRNLKLDYINNYVNMYFTRI